MSYIGLFDYNTDFDDKSVEKVGWNEATFFDLDFNWIWIGHYIFI